MGEVTYNCGRVVGWSAYEDFLKEHQIGPSDFPKADFVRMLEFGLASKITLKMTGWNLVPGTTNVWRAIVEVPGAVYGCTPVCGLDYEAYSSQDADKIETLRNTVSNIFAMFVSDSEGVPTTSGSEHGEHEGYLTFLAYPSVMDEAGFDKVYLLIKGLGVQSYLAGENEVFEHYKGPYGILAFDRSANDWLIHYERKIPKSSEVSSVVDSSPIIDLKSANGNSFYTNKPGAVTISVENLKVGQATASVLVGYQRDSEFPPALYAFETSTSEVDVSTDYKMWPLDSVAPGTVKLVVGDDVSSTETKAAYWERRAPGIYVFYRDETDQVLREIIDNTTGSVQSLPVAEVSTENLGGLHWYSRKCFRFTADGGDGGVGAKDSSLAAVNQVTCLTTLSGQVNQDFIDKFAVELSYLYDTTSGDTKGKFGLTISKPGGDPNNVMFQIVNQIPEADWSKYYAILVGTSSTAGSYAKKPSEYTLFLPILKSNRSVEYTTSNVHIMRPHLNEPTRLTLDFSYESHLAAETAGKKDRWLLMGTWWAGDVIDGAVTKPVLDNEGNPILDTEGHVVNYIDKHPAYQTYQKDEGLLGKEFIYMPEHATPKPPADQYGTDWPRWFSEVKMNEFFTSTEMESSGILSEYWEMSVNDFCESICIRGLSDLPSKENRATIQLDSFMLYSRETIADFAGRTVGNGVIEVSGAEGTEYEWSDYMKSDFQMRPIAKSRSFYAPAFLHFYPITWNQVNPTEYVVNLNDEKFFDDDLNAIWAAQTQTGEKTALSLSLTDKDGGVLPIDGNSGEFSVDLITWKSLLSALSLNESLDVLGKNLIILKNNQFQSISLKYLPTDSAVYSTPADPFYQSLTIEMLGISGRNTDTPGITAVLNLTASTSGTPPVITGSDSWYQVFDLTEECVSDLRALVKLTNSGDASGYSETTDIMITGNPAQVIDNDLPTSRCLNSILYISLKQNSGTDNSYGRAILYVKNNGEEGSAGSLLISGIVTSVYQESSGRYKEDTGIAAGTW